MKWILNTTYRAHIYRSIVAFVVGLVILFMPYDTLSSIVVMIGVFVLLAGVGSAVTAYRSHSSFFGGVNGTSSIVSIVVGLLCIFRPWFFVDIMILVIGIILSLVGLIQVFSIWQLRYGFSRNAFYYPGSIVTFLAGLFLVFFPQKAVGFLGVVLGIVLIVYALNEAGLSLRLRKMPAAGEEIEEASFEEVN